MKQEGGVRRSERVRPRDENAHIAMIGLDGERSELPVWAEAQVAFRLHADCDSADAIGEYAGGGERQAAALRPWLRNFLRWKHVVHPSSHEPGVLQAPRTERQDVA